MYGDFLDVFDGFRQDGGNNTSVSSFLFRFEFIENDKHTDGLCGRIFQIQVFKFPLLAAFTFFAMSSFQNFNSDSNSSSWTLSEITYIYIWYVGEVLRNLHISRHCSSTDFRYFATTLPVHRPISPDWRGLSHNIFSADSELRSRCSVIKKLLPYYELYRWGNPAIERKKPPFLAACYDFSS